ncbi:protein ACCELERATED CELL DEATH 6-like [Elaeis guineensis]|uniref:Protein ACCELERATED CELL DEATH 6-like n=1 Tax=Elaeis guineensis var. tenera TaxID=51953 RepID=A0A8N4F4L1_ELAGV|nr:protein ACCELERATED CELL DEATH 6-like [Elaeis guineensis]
MLLELLQAARSGNAARLRQIVAGCNRTHLNQVTEGGNTVLHIAAKMGHLELAKAICSLEPLLLTRKNFKSDTPVHCAARAGHHNILHYFVTAPFAYDRRGEEQEWFLRARNRFGNTALHEAAQNGHLKVAQVIMSVDSYLEAEENEAGVSPLYMAAERGSSTIVRLLLESDRCSYQGPNGQTALHAAVLRSYDITKLILEKEAGFIKVGDATNNSTPLHYAASSGNRKMVQLLLEKDSSASYLQDIEGLAPIHVAASAGHPNVIAELVQRRPDCTELITNQGRNFLHVAIVNKRLQVVKYVLESGILVDLNEPDNEGKTPLHLAVISKNRQIVQMLSSNGTVNTSIMNYEGHTPLDLAFLTINWEIALRMYNIMTDLINHGSRFTPQRLDLITNHLQRNQEGEIHRYKTLAKNLAIVAVLTATVTFAAAFTLPGGYKSDSSPNAGNAILANRAAFKVFLVSDSLAMISSISVAIIVLLRTGSLDHDIRLCSLITAMILMCAAVGGMLVAFATGIYVAVASDHKWLAVLIAVMICSVPLVAWMTAYWPSSDFLGLVKMTIIQETDVTADLDYRRYNRQIADRQRPGGIAEFHTP